MIDANRGGKAAGGATARSTLKTPPPSGIPADPEAEPMDAAERTGFAVRLALFYAALFLIYGVQLPYLPVWLDWRGLTAAEIAVVTAAPFFVRLAVTPALALHADHTGTHRAMIVGLSFLSVAAGTLLLAAPGFWTILATSLVLALAISSIMPLTEAIAVSGVRRGGLDYGRMRLWGSLTFVAATFAGGIVIARAGPVAGVWMILASTILTAAAALALPAPPRGSGNATVPPASRRLRLGEAGALVTSPVFLAFLLAAGATQAAHAAFYTFGALDWGRKGISPVMVGTLWTFGIAAEVLLFAGSGWVMQRVWATTLLIAGAAAAVLRWAVMALDPPLALLFPLQVLHGLTYGAAHLGAIHFIARAVPDTTAGTAQALYATVAAGVAMGLSTLLAGTLYGRFGGGTAYLAMTAVAALGLAAAFLVRRLWDGERLPGPAAISAPAVPNLPPEQG